MTTLSEFVKEGLAKGHTETELVAALKSKGFSDEQIRGAFGSPGSNPQLKNYILNYLQQGYSAEQIFDFLKKQNYKSGELSALLKEINTEYYNGSLNLNFLGGGSSKLILVMFLVLILLGGISYFYFSGEDVYVPSQSQMSLSASLNKNNFLIDEKVSVSVAPSNFGNSYDVDFILRSFDKKKISEESLTKTDSFTHQLSLPSELPVGKYLIQVVVEANSNSIEKELMFNIVDEIVEEEDEVYTEEEDETTDDVYVPPVVPSSSNVNVDKKLTSEQIFNLALKEKDKSKAIGTCEKITNDYLKVECLSQLAYSFNDEGICAYVTDEEKDYCYMNLIVNGKTELCDLVTSEQSKTLCAQYIFINSDLDETSNTDSTSVDLGGEEGEDINNLDLGDVLDS